MSTRLLEREADLGVLEEALGQACSGRGCAVLVYGEAGIGKTSLVRSFVESASARARVLSGACDDLLTPRTLGPFRDMAREAGGGLEALGTGSDRDAVFTAVRDDLARSPTVMIIEDVHWADDATLDVVRYLARRIGDLPALLVLTYRDGELRDDHPLRRVLGAYTGPEVRRIALLSLSREAVGELCSQLRWDAEALYAATGGNPFFVTEVLASPDVGVPATVLDAVLARVRELSEEAQRSLQLLSVIPGHTERALAERLLGEATMSLEEVERRGELVSDRERIEFRHEIARRAIELTLPPTARLDYNRRVLEALMELGDDVEFARLAHHASEANDHRASATYGLAAAREAVGAGAPHEALAHYERVLAVPQMLSEDERVTVMEESVWVLYHLARFQEAADRSRDVVALREKMLDEASLAQTLITHSRALYMVNDPAGSEDAVRRAVALLEPGGEHPELARAHSYLAAILKLTDRLDEAIISARRALEMAERTGRQDVVSHSLNYLGSALLDLGDSRGVEHLRRSSEIARSIRHYEYAQRAYTNLVEGLYRTGMYDAMDDVVELGLAYANDYDFPSHTYNIEAHRCMLLTLRGQWDEAEARLRELHDGEDPGVLASFGLSALGRLLARRGSPDARTLLERAWRAAARTNSVQAIALAGIARVESAWLAGEVEAAREFGKVPLERTEVRGAERYRGELLRWLARCGYPAKTFDGCPKEYALGIEGQWRAAADEWQTLGAPYESALELSEGGGKSEMLSALATLDELGARPAADITRQRLRKMGITRVPRGPQAHTRQNPAGLTARQVEVLVLMSQGLTNAEIAKRLVVSTRTVDHHVSAILAKLEVETRREASRAAAELGVTSLPGA